MFPSVFPHFLESSSFSTFSSIFFFIFLICSSFPCNYFLCDYFFIFCIVVFIQSFSFLFFVFFLLFLLFSFFFIFAFFFFFYVSCFFFVFALLFFVFPIFSFLVFFHFFFIFVFLFLLFFTSSAQTPKPAKNRPEVPTVKKTMSFCENSIFGPRWSGWTSLSCFFFSFSFLGC